MPPRSAAVVVVEAPVDVVAEIQIPQSERDSIDNDFFIFKRYFDGPIKKVLLGGLPKGDITVTISRK